jgi:putative transposase
MRSKLVAQLLADLGVTKTHSRPYTSSDNAYSESQFRTMKYRPSFPKRFGSPEDGLAFFRPFFRWYNHDHRHHGIALLTPAQVHYGQAPAVLRERQRALDIAYRTNPDRFASPPVVPQLRREVWINPPVTTSSPEKGVAAGARGLTRDVPATPAACPVMEPAQVP